MPQFDINFTGYADDLDDTVPGMLRDVNRCIPTTKGFIGAPTPSNLGLDALAATCTGAIAALRLDDTVRTIAGTATKLYERSGSTWSDVTRASGGDYNSSTDVRWRFAQVGNITLAANKGDTIQYSESGDFADISGAPKAAIVETVGDFVMAFDVNDGVNDYADGWHCSALGNYADWTESVSTQSASGRLLDVPGRIKAGKRLGSNIVAYKENGMWLGTYVGGDIIWAWQHIPGGVGAVSQEAVVEVNINGSPAHVFAGPDDIYMFDGSRPVSIGKPIKRRLQNIITPQYRARMLTSHDRTNKVVTFFLPGSSGIPGSSLAYNYETNQWGVGMNNAGVSMTLQYVGAGVTWDGMGTSFSTWDDLPDDITYDSPFWSNNRETPAFFNNDDNKLYSLTSTSADSRFTTAWLGSPGVYTTPTKARLKLITNELASANNYCLHDVREDNTGSFDETWETVEVDFNRGEVDLTGSALWHSFQWILDGDYCVTGMIVDYEVDGEY